MSTAADNGVERIVILPMPATTGAKRPACFYSMTGDLETGGQLCVGMACGDDDYPTEACQKCWFLDGNEELRESVCDRTK